MIKCLLCECENELRDCHPHRVRVCLIPVNHNSHLSMKTLPQRRASGFTLIELLVVITIIAVLAGAGFAAGNAAMQRARKTTTLAAIVSLETAVNNFYNDYGTFPVEGSADTTVNTTSGPGVDFLRVLVGSNTGTAATLNPRGIKYLNAAQGKNNKGGLIYASGGGSNVEGMYDAWGGPFFVMMDNDYDEELNVNRAAGGAKTLNGRRVAAWSNGADAAKTNGTGGTAADDVFNY